MKKYYYGAVVVLCLGLFQMLISCSRDTTVEETVSGTFSAYVPIELQLLELVNEHRAASGLKRLQRLDAVSLQARLHNNHMINTKEVCHHNFGRRYNFLVQKAGAKSMGENVGAGFNTAEAFFTAWMNSSHHRKIIEGDHTHFGLSASPGEGAIYVTLIFIKR